MSGSYFDDGQVEPPDRVVIDGDDLTCASCPDRGDTLRLFPASSSGMAPALVWETKGAAKLVLGGAELAGIRRRLARIAADSLELA